LRFRPSPPLTFRPRPFGFCVLPSVATSTYSRPVLGARRTYSVGTSPIKTVRTAKCAASANFLFRLDDDDALAAGCLPVPCVCDLVEAEGLEVDAERARLRVQQQVAEDGLQLGGRAGEVRMAEDLELLAADGSRREGRLRSGRLAVADDSRARRRGVGR